MHFDSDFYFLFFLRQITESIMMCHFRQSAPTINIMEAQRPFHNSVSGSVIPLQNIFIKVSRMPERHFN